MVLLALSMSLTSCNDDMGVPDNGKNPKDPDFKSIIVMSDIHVMAPQLLEKKGTAFDNYLSEDPKQLEYIRAVLA